MKNYIRKIMKNIRKRHAFDYPECQGGWKKHYSNPILNDGNEYFDPCVRIINKCFLMEVSNRTQNSIEFYKSANGIDWEKITLSLHGSDNNDWECVVNRASFLIKDSKIHMWYTGQNNGHSSIGFAVCDERGNFSKCRSNPVVTAQLRHEKKSVMNPCVIWDSEREVFRMWYSAGDNYEPDVICYAESSDGIIWKKNSAPVKTPNKKNAYEQCKVGACDVLRIDDSYLMAYISYQNVDVARISIAFSDDGINWINSSNNPIISPGKNRWDADAVYKPSIVRINNQFIIWYNGRNRTIENIGLAKNNRGAFL